MKLKQRASQSFAGLVINRCIFELWYNYSYTIRMKTAISIPNEVFDAAEQLSKRLGLSRSELYARAVCAYLAAYRHQRITETLDKIYQDHPSSVDPDLETMQWTSLGDDEWS